MKVLGTDCPGVGDVLTLANAACGVGAVLFVATHLDATTTDTAFDTLRPALLLLVLGTVFDVLDGLAARHFGGTNLGRQLDSMADAVTFGVAPAVVVGAVALSGAGGVRAIVVVAGVVLYLAGALLRLAQFSAQTTRPTHFTGLPSPLGAVCAAALVPLALDPVSSAVALAGLGLLMVSPMPYPLQNAVVAVIAVSGWSVGMLAVVGLLDAVVPAVATLVIILLVIPAARMLRPGAVGSPAVSQVDRAR